MKSYRKELWFNTERRYQFVHITREVQEAVRESGMKEGCAWMGTVENQQGNKAQAKIYFQKACDAGDQNSCIWLKSI